MRRLILLRHAAALPTLVRGGDMERPLGEHGRIEASAAAAYLQHQGIRPQLILCSPAVRTRETARILQNTFGDDGPEIRFDPTLYQGTPERLRIAIAACPESAHCLLVVAHNPGLSELAAELNPERQGTMLTTAEFCVLDLPVAGGWAQLGPRGS
ncbi:MAG TPA: histidine phosphatase family protein [Steroidobacteraceae bacterium]|nr:histidine phosphatase family protein [Steroidobacteraceae bacterium]